MLVLFYLCQYSKGYHNALQKHLTEKISYQEHLKNKHSNLRNPIAKAKSSTRYISTFILENPYGSAVVSYFMVNKELAHAHNEVGSGRISSIFQPD